MSTVLAHECSPPYDLYGEEFLETVQMLKDPDGDYVDGMNFVRRQPLFPPHEIVSRFQSLDRTEPHAVRDFVETHFAPYIQLESRYVPERRSLDDHNKHMLTEVLVCNARDAQSPLMRLEGDFIVPDAERFSGVMFGWDDDAVVAGLLAMAELTDKGSEDEREFTRLVESIIQCKADLIDVLGYVPNGTLTCLSSRAQPRVFANILDRYARYQQRRNGGLEIASPDHPLVKYLPQMLKEDAYWDRGKQYLEQHPNEVVAEHVIKMPDGYMYRSYDPRNTPRDESYREDVKMAKEALKYDPSTDVRALFQHIRTACADGQDFNHKRQNRVPELPWTNEAGNRSAPHVNAFVSHSKRLAAQGYDLTAQLPGISQDFKRRARAESARLRKEAKDLDKLINKYHYNPNTQLFDDYDFVRHYRENMQDKPGAHVGAQALISMAVLLTGSATNEHARAVVQREPDFRLPGGWAASLDNYGGQWTGKSIWAMMAMWTDEGLRKYGYDDIADRGRGRVVSAGAQLHARFGKIPEKYNGQTLEPIQSGEYKLFGDLAMSLGAIAKMRSDIRLEQRQLDEAQLTGGNVRFNPLKMAALAAALMHDVVR